MSNVINFKGNSNLMAIKKGNSFGDQIIAVIDLTKNSKAEDADFPYCAGQIIYKIVNTEGNWIPFTEKAILNPIRG